MDRPKSETGAYPDGCDWRCLRCEKPYPENFKPNLCPDDGGSLMRTMARLDWPPTYGEPRPEPAAESKHHR